jgi:AraC-like DNA-binding protein
MDILADWARLTGLSGALLARSRMEAPWGLAVPAGPEAMFHFVSEGICWLRLAGAPPLRLLQGDLVMLPNGPPHDLVHAPDGAAAPLAELLAALPLPAVRGPATTVVCGTYRFDASLAQPLLRGLPEVVHLPAGRIASEPSLASALSMLTRELERPGPGSEWLVQQLFDVLLVYLVRCWAAQAGEQPSGWLAALKDPALSKALSRMHASPQAPWTVAALAREAGLSRAAFARRFAAQVGDAPLAYLTRWRMGLASKLLRETDAPLAQIAARVGYDSEFSFSRAFKRGRGVAPIAFRRSQESAQPSARAPRA